MPDVAEVLPRVVACRCQPSTPEAVPAFIVRSGSLVRMPGRIDSGLRGIYPLGEWGGSDISGLENDGVSVLDSAETESETVKGMLCEQAELMDGRQGYLLPFDLEGSITVSLFIRPMRVRAEQTILQVGPYLRFGLTFLGEPIVSVNRLQADEAHVVGPRLSDDAWYHLAFIFAVDGLVRMYLDGEQADVQRDGKTARVATVPTPISRGAPVLFSDGQRFGVSGAAQDVIIRQGVMTAEEMAIERDSYCTALMEVVSE